MEKVQIPDRLYYRIGEVSRIASVPPYVLRFWEKEFRQINPKRTPSGQRLYRKKDVELILTIKHLLYEKKFTIEGARRRLRAGGAEPDSPPGDETLEEIRDELIAIRRLLS
jgi:DNA-binding transcriptional MerR regulator